MEHGLLFLFAAFAMVIATAAEDCVWNKDTDYPDEQPLIFDEMFNLVLPVMNDTKREVRVSSGASLTIACPGSRNVLVNFGTVSVQATCAGGTMLNVQDSVKPMSEFGCTKKVRETIKQHIGSCGHEDRGQLNIIGFKVEKRFYEQIFVCFDYDSQTTLYTRHVVKGANIAAKDTDSSRPSFKSSRGYFSVSMNTVYSQASQKQLFIDLLGDENLANSLFSKYNYYFARGHLAPDADFVTEPEQDATYYYINAAPQWQIFNNGNWKYLEVAVRELAEKEERDFRVYTGAWGLLKLKDINNNDAEMYLGLAVDKQVVPVPALTWKVIHDEYTNRALAVVGINNPHLTTAPETLCEDKCASIPWIDFDTSDLKRGFTYCCTVSDLRDKIPNVPDLGNVDILN